MNLKKIKILGKIWFPEKRKCKAITINTKNLNYTKIILKWKLK